MRLLLVSMVAFVVLGAIALVSPFGFGGMNYDVLSSPLFWCH